MHGPLEAPEEYLELYPEVTSPFRRKYLAMVTAMDAAIGKVTSALKNSALWEEAIVLFFSDNGATVGGWPIPTPSGIQAPSGLSFVVEILKFEDKIIKVIEMPKHTCVILV